MEKIRVSVIVPVYNSEEYLESCLESLLNQSLQEIEIICVDDGSTDHSRQILEEYAAGDERIRVMHQRNRYAGVARNRGLSAASGEYVIFLDSDDFFKKDLLEKTYHKAKSTDADIVIFGARKYNTATKVSEKTRLYFKPELLPKKRIFSRRDVPDRIMTITSPAPWTYLYRREFLLRQNLQFQPLQNSNDAYFTLLALCVAERISYVKEDLVYYRTGQKNNLQSRKSRYPTCFIEAYTALYEELKRRNIFAEVEKSYVKVVLSGCSYNLDTTTDPLARLKICRAMAAERFLASGIMEHPASYYPDQRQYDQVQECIDCWHRYETAWNDCIREKESLQKADMISDEPQVSIIIPVYNTEAYIVECMESVCCQTFRNIEIIVVNDGTPDHSIRKISEIAADDARIKMINKENGGLSSARNAGMKAAKGEYILFLDSDDKLYDRTVELLYVRAKTSDLDELFFGALPFRDETGAESEYNQYAEYYKRKSDYSGIWKGTSLFTSFVSHEDFKPSACMQLLKRSFLEKNGITFLEGILHEDNLFTMQCLLKAERAGVFNLELYCRRIHDNSIMTQRKGMKNVHGYYMSIVEMLRTIAQCDKADEFYTDSLEKQFHIMIQETVGFMKDIPESGIEEYRRNLSAVERILFDLLIMKAREYDEAVSEGKGRKGCKAVKSLLQAGKRQMNRRKICPF